MARARTLPSKAALGPALALAILVSACGGQSATSTPPGSSAPASGIGRATDAQPTGTAAPGETCAWATRADKATLNVAYPDTAATYWGISYQLAPGESIELQGTFPEARYASFITYKPTGGAIDVIADRDIAPDAGSTNPFASTGTTTASSGGEHHYTLRIRTDVAPDAEANALAANPAVAPDAGTTEPANPTTTGTAPARANLLGSGGAGAVGGTVLYRVYVPDDAAHLTDQRRLPGVTVVKADGSRTPVPTCATSGSNPAAIDLVNANGPSTDRPAPAQPVFLRPQAGATNLYPNPDNVYVATITQHQPGQVVVVRGKAPTFPDPAEGRAIGTGEQVRYWSLCTNEYRKPYPVSTCVTDRDVALDADGWFTFVASTPEDRPANATAEHGVTWIDWGSTDVNMLVLLRHMLASPDFPQSAINLQPGSLATTTMGDYAPKGAYCEKTAFERDDPSCLPA